MFVGLRELAPECEAIVQLAPGVVRSKLERIGALVCLVRAKSRRDACRLAPEES